VFKHLSGWPVIRRSMRYNAVHRNRKSRCRAGHAQLRLRAARAIGLRFCGIVLLPTRLAGCWFKIHRRFGPPGMLASACFYHRACVRVKTVLSPRSSCIFVDLTHRFGGRARMEDHV
jgi:hypothetical protein